MVLPGQTIEGRGKVQIQLYMIALVLNLKRLLGGVFSSVGAYFWWFLAHIDSYLGNLMGFFKKYEKWAWPQWQMTFDPIVS